MREMWDGIAVEWNSADVEPDIRLHYGLTGNGERLLVLVHGDP